MVREKSLRYLGMGLLFIIGLRVLPASAEELRRRGMMGVQLSPLNPELQAQLKLESNKGVLVSSTLPDSAAAVAGILGNDVIRRIGGDPTDDITTLMGVMRKYYGGDTIQLYVWRDGAEKVVELTLRPRPKETSEEFDILYESAGEPGQRVRTLVTKPKSEGKRPAVLIITGISPQSMELPPPNPHPIKSMIQEFNKAGYVTMRVERLGLGDSEGIDLQKTTVAADVASFRAALAKLRSYDFVNPDQVYLLGHSLGTTLVPVVAKDQKLAGIVTFAGAFRPWPEAALEMMERRGKLELLPEDKLKERTEALKILIDQYVVKKQSPETIAAQSPQILEALGHDLFERGYVFGMPAGYGREIAEVPAAAAWAGIKVPVLALLGEADFIASRSDSEKIAETVNKNQPGKGCFIALPGVDHMMSKAADQEESFLAGQGSFNPKFMERLLKWMADQGC